MLGPVQQRDYALLDMEDQAGSTRLIRHIWAGPFRVKMPGLAAASP